MPRKNLSDALNSSLKAEDEAVRNRFEVAERAMGDQHLNFTKESTKSSPAPFPENQKVIRDTFCFPQQDYELIEELKQRCLKEAMNASKSELIRAGLNALSQMKGQELVKLVQNLEKVKTGRPAQR